VTPDHRYRSFSQTHKFIELKKYQAMAGISIENKRKFKRLVLTLIGVAILILFINILREDEIGGDVFLIFLSLSLYIFIKIKWRIPADDSNSVTPYNGPKAGWATIEEFDRANGVDPNNDEQPLGKWIGGGFTRVKHAHIVTIGGSSQGKSSSLAIPFLLSDPIGSEVITDIKGELAYITARTRKALGQRVFILDPFDLQHDLGATHGIKSAGFNPLAYILKRPTEELRDNADVIAYSLVPDKPGDRDPFWASRSRSLIRTILLHILTARPKEEHNFYSLYKAVRLGGDEWVSYLYEMKKNPALDGIISIAAEEFLGLIEANNTMMGIRANAQDATAIFESPQLRHFLQKNDFDPDTLSDGDVTVYIVLPERYIDTHYTWLRMMISMCIKAVNAKPNNPVHFLLDEFPICKKMPDVQRAFAFGRGQNLHMWIFAQSIPALRELYGEDGVNGFISNSAVLQCFGGVRDQPTRELFSKLLGNIEVIKTSESFGSSKSKDGTSWSETTNRQLQKEPLLSPDAIGNCSGIITIADSHKFIIKKRPYYQNMYKDVSPHEPWLSKEDRDIIKSGRLPADPLYELFKERADQMPNRNI
jgi:type IV secretion system protein VirD4